MSNNFNPFQLLDEIAKSATTGVLRITSNCVIWELEIIEGKLQLATHSLQSWNTCKYYLLRLNYHEVAKTNPLVNKKPTGKTQLIKEIIEQLEANKSINPIQKAQLNKKITEDAIESLLCLSSAEYKWLEQNIAQLSPSKINSAISKNQLIEIKALVTSLKTRLTEWQKLHQFINSPYQRPYCLNPSLVEQSVPLGALSINVLKQLVKAMKGLSIRELALFVKQDELKLAQLLSVYIKHKVLQLYPPKSPLNLLPNIPAAFPKTQEAKPTNNNLQNTLKNNLKNSQSTYKIPPKKTKYKIICIDDSPVMLEMIENYLGKDKYELMTVEEPMKSLSSMFKSNADLILMDISMPSINGNKLCQIFKKSPVFKSTPIILISGNTKLLNEETLKNTGATDFLAKPFNQQALVAIIEKYCNFSHIQKLNRNNQRQN